MSNEELKVITNLIGCICDYSPVYDYMAEHCNEWCDKNCGNVSEVECLKKYIETKYGKEN